MTTSPTTQNPAAKRSIVLLAKPDIVEIVREQLAASGVLIVKAVSSIKEALTSIPTARPHALLIEDGAALPQHVLAARQLAELSASRKVPVVIFGGPLDPAWEAKRDGLGIADVVDGEFYVPPVVQAIQTAIGRVDEKMGLNKPAGQKPAKPMTPEQQQKAEIIRQRLAQAAQKLKPPPTYDVEQIEGAPDRRPFDAQALPKDE